MTVLAALTVVCVVVSLGAALLAIELMGWTPVTLDVSRWPWRLCFGGGRIVWQAEQRVRAFEDGDD